ncbi:MAG: adenylate cyclase [Candidatus Latescibacterota bacterium]|jgi:adenylate cyclase
MVEKTRILIIDDSPTTRILLEAIVLQAGFEVLLAEGGEQGLALARSQRPQVIVLDVLMPDLDGWAVLSRLKSDPVLSDIPVLMLSILEDQSKGFVLGASDYLTKPISRIKLIDTLRRLRLEKQAGPVLVVEDDPGTRQITSAVLQSEGWEVMEAGNGAEALVALDHCRPQLILLDLVMPEMNGFEFIDIFYTHPQWRNIPIIVVTAQDLSEKESIYLNRYVEQVLRKGCHSREDLLQTISDLLHNATGV